MSWIDLVIAGVVILAAVRGYSTGALRQIGSFAGFVGGFILGVQIAASLATDMTRAAWRPAAALGLVLVIAFAGSVVGYLLGSLAGRSLHVLRMGLVDRVAGVAVGAAGALLACWLTAGLLVSTPWEPLASAIQNSAGLKALDAVMPSIPSVEARVQALVRNADFPNMFSSIISPVLPGGPTPHLGPWRRGLSQPSGVVKVLTLAGCVNDHEGTGFYVAAHEVVTNAHVVAGASRVMAGGAPAVVIYFDPRQDLAILRVPTRQEPSLALLRRVPASATAAYIVGFPLNGRRTGAPAVVRGELSGLGRDIYNRQVFTRTLLVVNANVASGNSGSPVLVHSKVAGVVVSKSLTQSETAYAIPETVLRHDLAQATSNRPVPTGSCLP
jgi:S1-C subfamily serine protease